MRPIQCRICPELHAKIEKIRQNLGVSFPEASRIYMLSKDIRITFHNEDQTVERMIR